MHACRTASSRPTIPAQPRQIARTCPPSPSPAAAAATPPVSVPGCCAAGDNDNNRFVAAVILARTSAAGRSWSSTAVRPVVSQPMNLSEPGWRASLSRPAAGPPLLRPKIPKNSCSASVRASSQTLPVLTMPNFWVPEIRDKLAVMLASKMPLTYLVVRTLPPSLVWEVAAAASLAHSERNLPTKGCWE